MKNKNIILLFLAMFVLASWATAAVILTLNPNWPAGNLIIGTTYSIDVNYYCEAGTLNAGATLTYTAGSASGSVTTASSCTCQGLPGPGVSTKCGTVSFSVTPPPGSSILELRMNGILTPVFGSQGPISAYAAKTIVAAAATVCGDSKCSPLETCATSPSTNNDCPKVTCMTSTCTTGSCVNAPIADSTQESGLCDDNHGCEEVDPGPGCMCLSGSCMIKTVSPPPPPPPPPPGAAPPVEFYQDGRAAISSGGLACNYVVEIDPNTGEDYLDSVITGGTPPYIYVWQLDGDKDDLTQPIYLHVGTDFATGLTQTVATCNGAQCNMDLGFRKNLSVAGWPAGDAVYRVCLKAADSRTDTQILDQSLIREEVRTEYTTLRTDCLDLRSQINNKNYRFSGGDSTSRYRLFEDGTVWVKILGITPQLYDNRINEYFTRTGAPDRLNTTIYVIAGAKRKTAYTSFGRDWYYSRPISDKLTVTVDYGNGDRTSETIIKTFDMGDPATDPLMRSLLAFPPADSIGDFVDPAIFPHTQIADKVLHLNTEDGWAYSFFTYSFMVPDNAQVIDITTLYNVETSLFYSTLPTCRIDDNTTVYDKYFIREGLISRSNLNETNITLTGYYDIVEDPLTHRMMAKGGYIHINITPDVLAGVRLEVDDNRDHLPAATYQHLLYPARHVLYRKGKVGAGPATKVYVADDDYAFKNPDFGYDPTCFIPVCTGDCRCGVSDPLNPVCKDYATDPMNPRIYKPNSDDDLLNDCRCALDDECINNPCDGPYASGRTYHDDEGGYFDFVDFYTQTLTPPEKYINAYPDNPNNKKIAIDKAIEDISNKKSRPADKWFCFCTTEGQSMPAKWLKTYVVNYVPYTAYVKGCPDTPPVGIDRTDYQCGCWVNHISTSFFLAGFVADGRVTVGINNLVPFVPPECTFDVGSIGYPPGTTATQGIYDITDCIRFGDNTIAVDAPTHGDLGVSGCINIQYQEQNIRSRVEELYFSTYGILGTDFEQWGNITIFTHFRNISFLLSKNLVKRVKTDMIVSFSPGLATVKRGDTVTVTVHLSGATGDQDVEISVPGYENQLIGVWWSDGKAHVTTKGGIATFQFKLGYAPAQVTAKYNGIYTKATVDAAGNTVPATGYTPSQAGAVVGTSQVQTSIASTDFIILIVIMFILILFWRWFRGGRLDFYNMWQEFKGEATDEE